MISLFQIKESHSQPEIQRPTSSRIRPRVYQQTSNRLSLNLSLPQYTTPLTIRSENLSPVKSVSSRTRTPPTLTFFNRPEERSPSPLKNLRQFQRDYLTRADTHSSDEETTYQPIAGSSRPNPNQNLINFSNQIIVNYSQHNSQEEQQEEQEEEQDNRNNNPLFQYYNPNIENNNNIQKPEEDNPSGGLSREHTNNNSDIQEESEEEMAFVVKPPKFSGVHNEDPKEWLEDFVMGSHVPRTTHERESNTVYTMATNQEKAERDETPSLVIQHLIQETIKGEVKSPLIPCEECELKNTTSLRDSRILLKNETKKCLIRTDINQIRSISTRQRIVSTTHKEDKRIKRRLLISPKSVRIYFENTTNIGSTNQQKDTSVSTGNKINDLKAELLQYAQIVFYTDGSLLKNQEQGNHKGKRGEDKMDIGLAISPEGYDEKILDFSTRITGPASSSRAELWAILMALELAPPNTKIKIYTDSASAIAAIKRFMVDKGRKKAKDLKNPNVLQAISDKCNGKRNIFELNKVKAHTGVFLNEKADLLVKESVNSNSWIKINPEFLQRRINFEWKNQSIDTDIKEFSKREQKINWYVNWKTQYKVVKWCNQNITKETDWKLIQHFIHKTKISSKNTDKEDNNNRTFSIKVLNDELPNGFCINLKKSKYFKNPKSILGTCITSTKKSPLKETRCLQGYDSIIRNKLIQQLAIIEINQGSKKKKAELVAALQKESFIKIDVGRKLRGIVKSDHFSLVDMIRGLVYKHMQNKIKTIIITDTNKVKEIQKQILIFLRMIMKKQWEERCKLFLK
ncbi:hypothetical protein Glove_375g87 [Diversispora epigaea]|uniref:RNase H type-1 domain-containing protein n=1 Tax=Diversispora epigaea TaxID=1348612 RepID=A0A397H944_9GLOM|nr:hypothetical protein Glove_375g87 [Diversispora epigaea]